MSSSTASGLLSKLGYLWCRLAHEDIIWPIHDQYRCRRCWRSHSIPWADPKAEIAGTRPGSRAHDLVIER
ncbi:MAG TPA: hypothetical protein VMF91_19810 [Bryobacteraceae bacterium]|nr:hypothetical protein [Bryobacteraceae bacterium]